MRLTTTLPVLCTTLGMACSGRATPPLPVATTPCTIPGVNSSDSLGRLVHASGFTFCVPSDWRPSGHARDSTDAAQWNGSGGSITWGLARPPSMEPRCVYTITGQVTTSPSAAPPPRPLPTPAPAENRRSTNTPVNLDGVSVIIHEAECRGTRTITAWSTDPAMYVQGIAQSAALAQLQLSVIQTIRFSARTR